MRVTQHADSTPGLTLLWCDPGIVGEGDYIAKEPAKAPGGFNVKHQDFGIQQHRHLWQLYDQLGTTGVIHINPR